MFEYFYPMKLKYFSFLLLSVLLLTNACSPESKKKSNNDVGEVQKLQVQLEAQEEKLEQAESRIKTLLNLEENYPLVHTVYLNLKEGVGKRELQELFESIEKLHDIDVVHDLDIGFFKDLEDKRALKELEWVFQMRFKNADAYSEYQKHPLHLALKEVAKPLLDGPPVTHDFMSQK